MDKKFMNASAEVEALDRPGWFEGYASVFDHTDSVRDMVVRGAFKDTLKHKVNQGKMPPLLWQHDTAEPIGIWRDIYEDHHGLYVRGELFVEDIPRARQAWKLMREAALTGLSIGFKAVESHRDAQSGTRILSKIDLLEISIVTFPALDSARISRVRKSLKAGEMPDERSLEAFLREAGFSRKQAKGFIAAGYKSIAPRDADAVNDTKQAIRELTQKLTRWADHSTHH